MRGKCRLWLCLALVGPFGCVTIGYPDRELVPSRDGGESPEAGLDGGVVVEAGTDAGGDADAGTGGLTDPPCDVSCWAYHRQLVLASASVSGDGHASFPALVSAQREEWKAVTYGGHVALEDGSDLLFTSDDGGTVFPHEIEQYDPSTGTVVAWVRVPALSSQADTTLAMHYGNPAAIVDPRTAELVWEDGSQEGFRGVWHLASDDRGKRVDSTFRENHCSGWDYDGDEQVSAIVGHGDYLDGSDDYLDCGTSLDFDFREQVTVSMWLQLDVVPAGGAWMLGALAESYGFYVFGQGGGTARLGVYYNIDQEEIDRFNTSSPFIEAGQWVHLATTYDGTAVRGFVNGKKVEEYAVSGLLDETRFEPLTAGFNADSYFVGSINSEINPPLKGSIDELRLSSVARSQGWLATSYANQRKPAEFVTVGPEQMR